MWNYDGVDGENYKSTMGDGVGVVGMGCGGGGGWVGGIYCLLEVPQGCSCQVIISCNALLKASGLVWVNTLGGSLFHWAIVRGKKLFIIVVGGGYVSVFVWVVGSCLAVSGYMRFWLGLISKRSFVIYTWCKVWPQPSSVPGMARRGQRPRWIQMFPSCSFGPRILHPGAGPTLDG